MSLKYTLDSLQQTAKERTVKTQSIEYDLETLVKKVNKGIIKLNPDYQRRHRWDDDTSSKLIESLILNIPVPLIYISQDIDVDEEADSETSRYSVIDGQQRLTAICQFFNNKFKLSGLEVLGDLNEAFYKDLPPFLVRRLEERSLRCLRIDSTVDLQVKYDIFERLNSGSVKLEAQELRNATCRGPFKEMIKDLAEHEAYKRVINLTASRKQKMDDQELILRFFAVSYDDGYKLYKDGFKDFLTTRMTMFNQLDENTIDKMKADFVAVIDSVTGSLGDLPFAKFRHVSGVGYDRMSKFNASVYDAIMMLFYKKSKEQNITSDEVRALFKDSEFFDSIEGSILDVSKVKTRITKALNLLK